MIQWNNLADINQLETLIANSFKVPQVIFKHSTRCSISSMVLGRFERFWNLESSLVAPHFLDLIANRSLSNTIGTKFDVMHESPQLLLIQDGVCIYHSSHNSISVESLNLHLTRK